MQSTDTEPVACDVLILGASMAGSTLARQLSLEHPELRVTVLEERERFDHGVGESTVEQFDDYATRVLRLGPYLFRKHVLKHGLRFWFDSPERDLALTAMSEMGRAAYPIADRSFQIDRKAFDTDLVELNRANGVDVRMGVTVLARSHDERHLPGIDFDRERGHLVRTTQGDFRCRWLVDAAGWGSPIVRQLGLLDTEHAPAAKGALWGRFRVRRTMDELGDEAWRARVEHTLRWASTNHFLYDGYWIWVIGLAEDLVSIGVTYDRGVHDLDLHGREQFERFLRSHRALDELLGEGAELEDYHRMPHVVRGSRQFFSTDRWFLTGMSGLFVDPLYSSSCVFIALANRLIASMIEADLAGDARRFAARVKHFDAKMRGLFLRQTVDLGDYHRLGSFDAFLNWHTQHYHALLAFDAPLQHADYAPLVEEADAHGPDCACSAETPTASQRFAIAASRLATEFVAFLDARGAYHARNRGWFAEVTERDATRSRASRPLPPAELADEARTNWEAYVRYYLARPCELDGVVFREPLFRDVFDPDWESGQSLAELFDALRLAPAGDAEPATESWWSPKGPITPQLLADKPWWCRFLDPEGELVRPGLPARR